MKTMFGNLPVSSSRRRIANILRKELQVLLNRFISAKTYRAVAQPDRQTDGGATPRPRRMSQIARLRASKTVGLHVGA